MSDKNGEFDRWAATFHDYYESGSRAEYEFRLTRKMVITARKWTAFIDDQVRRKTGFSRSRWQTLAAIAFAGGPVTTLELSGYMGVQWPTVVRALGEMEAEGLIARTRSGKDRRYRTIAITPAGQTLLDEVLEITNPLRATRLADIATEDLIVSERVLDRILAALPR